MRPVHIPKRRVDWRALTLLCSALGWACGNAVAQEGGDPEAQIIYAWQSGDLARLQSLQQGLHQGVQVEHPSAASRYHLAHADYRVALLRNEQHQSPVREPLQECVEQLGVVLEADPGSTESLILQAACYVELAPLRKLQAAIMRAHANRQLDRAQGLAPQNPRAELVRGMQLLQTHDQGFVPRDLFRAAELFERAPATGDDVPGWGYSETCLLLGKALRVHGDALGARNWIEKALIVAPHYRAAQTELALLHQ